MGQELKTEARLKLTADTKDASAAVKSLSKDVKELSQASDAANAKTGKNSGFRARSTAKDLDENQPAAGADSGKGITKSVQKTSEEFVRLAGKAALATATIAAFAKGLGEASVASSRGKSAATQAQAFFEAIPILGEIARSMKSAVVNLGYSKSMANARNQERASQQGQAYKDIYTPAEISVSNSKASRQAAAIRADVAGVAGPNRAQNRAEYGTQFEDSINAAEFARNRANRERDIATKQRQEAVKAAKETSGDAYAYGKQADELYRQQAKEKNPVKQMALGSQIADAEKGYQAALEKQKNALEKHRDAVLSQIEASKAAREAETALMAAKRDRAKTLLDETRNAAASFGASTDEDKYMLAASARMAKENGIDSLAPEQKQMLLGNGLTSEWAKKQLIQSAQNDPMLNSILQDTGRGTIQQQEKNVAAMNAQIDAKISLDEKAIEAAVAAALKTSGINIEYIITQIARGTARQFDNKMNQNALAQGLGLGGS